MKEAAKNGFQLEFPQVREALITVAVRNPIREQLYVFQTRDFWQREILFNASLQLFRLPLFQPRDDTNHRTLEKPQLAKERSTGVTLVCIPHE